jgi:hypothetical protein
MAASLFTACINAAGNLLHNSEFDKASTIWKQSSGPRLVAASSGLAAQ